MDAALQVMAEARVTSAATLVGVFAKVSEQLHEAALVVGVDVGDHGADAAFLAFLSFLVDGVRDAQFLVLQAGGEIDDGGLLAGGDVVEHVESREEEQAVVERLAVEACTAHDVVLADAHKVGE